MKTFTMSDEDAIILEKIMLDHVEYRPEYFGSLVKAVLGDEPLRPCPFCGRQRPYVSRVELPTCWEMYVLCEGCGDRTKTVRVPDFDKIFEKAQNLWNRRV